MILYVIPAATVLTLATLSLSCLPVLEASLPLSLNLGMTLGSSKRRRKEGPQ